MGETPKSPFDILPDPPGEGEPLSEHLLWDNPRAREVAKPLFDADIVQAAITWRKGRRSKRYHWSNPHRFTLVLQGEMKALLGDPNQIKTLRPGDLMYCPPGVGFRYVCDDDVLAHWLYITIDNTEFWDPLKRAGPFIRQYDSAALVYILLRKILDAHKSRDGQAMSAARGESKMLTTLLRRLRHHGPTVEPGPHVLQLRKLVDEIARSPAEDWTQKRMTDRLHVSPSTLRRLCHWAYGAPPKELLIKVRMGAAGQLLVHTNDQLPEIAVQVGYDSVYSFSRIFKQYMGAPPARYRRNQRRLAEMEEMDTL